MSQGQRRLAAIMFTDIVGYTSLSQKNEALAMQLLEEHRSLVRPFFPKHNGREVKTIGDAFLVEFASALEAVRCAFDIQQSIREMNSGRMPERQVQIRIGIHLGDVIHDQNDVYGDAVNVASRIEPLAVPGGICVSQQVYDHVKNKFEFPLTSIGKRELKNVGEPVEVYMVQMAWGQPMSPKEANSLPRRRIAVLPFANMSPDSGDAYFSDGMTEELITSLSGIRELSVIARTSVMKYKNSGKGAYEIGRELGAGSLMEGSVRKAGDRVRITVQLIDTTSEDHLWAQNYDRHLDDIFVIQSEIAEKVAGELRIRLVDSEKRVTGKKSTGNTEAYTCFLQARELLIKGDEPLIRQAIGLFEKAIELDPSFARAYVGLAACYQRLGNSGYDPYAESIARAKVPLMRALDLDPDLAEVHVGLSLVLMNEDNGVEAETEARKAIELNPSLPEAYDQLANVIWLKSEVDEGTRLVETCYHLDPIRPAYVTQLGRVYFYLGRESEALAHWEKTAELAPFGTYSLMTEYYLSKGDHGKAKELYSMAGNLRPTSPWVTWMRGFIAAQMGDREGALGVIRQIEESKSGGYVFDSSHVAYIYHGLGDLDSFFEYMNRTLDVRPSLFSSYVMYCPLFAKGRADPRYQTLIYRMRRMDFPEKK